jgi:hypothetical protein
LVGISSIGWHQQHWLASPARIPAAAPVNHQPGSRTHQELALCRPDYHCHCCYCYWYCCCRHCRCRYWRCSFWHW